MTTYYVSKIGNNVNNGTSISTAWKTITKAANTIVAGDTVYVKAGSYNERVIPKNNGTSSSPITYKNFGTEIVTVDGTGINVGGLEYGMVDIAAKDYIIFDGFHLNRSNGCGIRIDEFSGKPSSNIIVRNNTFIGAFAWGAIRTGYGWNNNYITISNNHIENNGSSLSDNVEQISISKSQHFTISNNYIKNTGTTPIIGIDCKDDSRYGDIFNNYIALENKTDGGGIYFDARGLVSNMNVYNNEIINGNVSIALACETDDGYVNGSTIDTVNVFNNLCHNNQLGIWISGYSSAANPVIKNITVENNTLVNNTANLEAGNVPTIQNVNVRNNIFYNGYVNLITSNISGYALEYNNYYNAKSTPAGTNEVNGDPKFVNLIGNDFHLQSTSPCINKGTTTGAPSFDKDRIPRPQGIAFDIGAYEYKSAVGQLNSLEVGLPIKTGTTVQLAAKCRDQNNNYIPCQTMTWSSSNMSVATVNSLGVVEGIAAGISNITTSVSGITSNNFIIIVT